MFARMSLGGREPQSAIRCWLTKFRLVMLALLLLAPEQSERALRAAPVLSDEVHAPLYLRQAAAVVGITCKRKQAQPDELGSFFGTGVVVDPKGLILTCITVVPEDGTEIKVFFTDGRVLPAELVRVDKETEGVLIRVTAEKLVAMRLGDSAGCRVGDPAYSWGNPFHTIMKDGAVSLSSGTISGIYQISSVDPESRYMGLVLETDAAVNPGSDGGPLTDADGNLLGIQSLAFSRTRWLGTAIPAHLLADKLPELKDLPRTARPEFTGAKARVWAMERAFPEVITEVAAATVSLRILRTGERGTPPERRQDEKLETLAPYPSDARRAAHELLRPGDAYATGVTISSDGIVLTAAQNLAPPPRTKGKIKSIYVYLADGSRVPAKVLGEDAFYDLAVLQLEGEANRTYPRVPVAERTGLLPGQWVAILGRSEPPGDYTLNCGPLSATNRFQGTCSQLNLMLNYGNLGGPVVDLDGRLVGVGTQLGPRTAWRQNCGVAFMLNAEIIQQILPDLKAGKKLDRPMRPYLGVMGDVGALDVKGARVNQVMPESAAARADIRKGDVITQFNGQDIGDWESLVRAILATKAGDTIKVKLRRGEEELEVEVEMGQRE